MLNFNYLYSQNIAVKATNCIYLVGDDKNINFLTLGSLFNPFPN